MAEAQCVYYVASQEIPRISRNPKGSSPHSQAVRAESLSAFHISNIIFIYPLL